MDATAILSAIACDEQALGFMEHVTRHVSSVQDYVLQLLLEANAGTDYFQRHGLYGIPTKEEFRRLLPITTYSDMEADFQRLANGDESKTICAARVLEMLTSSGTSGGKQKLFPKSPSYDQEFVALNRVARAALNKKAPYASRGKSLQFFYVRKPGITSGGVTTTSGLSGYFTSPAFRQRKLDPESGYTSPDQVILCVDYQQASYCHLLCGLTQSQEVVSIGAPFASTLVRSLKALKDLWQELCVDIETGRVNDNIVSDLSVKHAVNALLKPDPKLAALVRRECSKSNWRGIVRRLWPRARIIQAIVTGSMQQYVPAIDFFSDGLPIASSIYAASECSTLGVNLSPVCSPYDVRYSPFPCFVYYEFLPVSSSSSSSPRRDDLVQLAEVELGREYELVITTRAGLYRYRVGDVLKVVGFKNSMPQFSFVGRAGVLLSVDTDKTDEVELHTAVTTAAAVMAKRNRGDVRLLDYTSRVNLSSQPGHYVVYWELSLDAAMESLEAELRECCSVMEESLSVVYRRNRREGSVGALEIKVVEPGTFDRIVDHVVFVGQGSIGQYKTPRCARDPAVLRILESSVVESSRAR
ncbi:hypothetical protein SELMODRAFT_87623 [Selaginella moellendorffii]|uniref:Uncharacterized protein DFL1L3-2 n=1 Tax=Selaginella moellendorffii TaxID=88036 RepID=D8R7U4_SELML|nr:hypothetical protein SELMODRAFT_87623 [Selaginella moellendorffii]